MNRRKPMLNIGPKSLNRNTPERESSKNGAGLGLLGSYNQDIDGGYSHQDDDSSDDEKRLPHSTLDSKVADFLKEIDDLDVAVPSTNIKSKKKEKSAQKVEDSTVSSADYSQNQFISWGNWQQCIDENTQHPYYWNTKTNEVTWTLPDEIAVQYEKIVETSPTFTSTEEISSKKEKSAKEKHQKFQKSEVKKEKRVNTESSQSIKKASSSKAEKVKSKASQLETMPDLEISNKKVLEESQALDVEIPVKRQKLSLAKDTKKSNVNADSEKSEIDEDKTDNKEKNIMDDIVEKIDETLTNSKKIEKSPETNQKSDDVEDQFNTLICKFTCLETSRLTISELHQLFMEVEIRLMDWKNGALSSEYVEKKLEEMQERMNDYEKTIMPSGWLCHWDSRYNRYYYTNNFGRTQWDFPTTEESSSKATEKITGITESDTAESKSGNNLSSVSSIQSPSVTISSDSVENKDSTSSNTNSTSSLTNNMISYPGFNMHGYYWNMHNFNMFRPPGYNSPLRADQPPPPPPPGEDAAPLPPTPEDDPPPPPPPPAESDEPVSPPPLPPLETVPVLADGEDGIEMEISDVEEEVVIEPSIKETEDSPVAQLKGAPVDYSSKPLPPTSVKSLPPPILPEADPVEKFKKIKRTKKDKGPLKKPPKQMFGMVAKWQKAKQEMEEEEKRMILESEQELNQENDVQQRIQKWKIEQLQSGKAAFNANFEPVSDEWKKRVKQRKNNVT